MDFILKTAKRKLPLHENSFVKATAPLYFVHRIHKNRCPLGYITKIYLRGHLFYIFIYLLFHTVKAVGTYLACINPD